MMSHDRKHRIKMLLLRYVMYPSLEEQEDMSCQRSLISRMFTVPRGQSGQRAQCKDMELTEKDVRSGVLV